MTTLSPKERPTQGCAGLSLDKLEDRLEAPGGKHVVDARCYAVDIKVTVTSDGAEGLGTVLVHGACPVIKVP